MLLKAELEEGLDGECVDDVGYNDNDDDNDDDDLRLQDAPRWSIKL